MHFLFKLCCGLNVHPLFQVSLDKSVCKNVNVVEHIAEYTQYSAHFGNWCEWVL